MTRNARAGRLARRRRRPRRARAHARPRPPHAGAHLAQPVRRVRRDGPAQGREPAAHRLVQAARRAGQGRRASAPAAPGGRGRAAPATTRSRSPTRRARAASTARSSCPPRPRWRRSPRCAASAGPCGSAATRSTSCVGRARERAAETGAVFVHPFDDPEIVAGQGTLGLELLDDVPEHRDRRRAGRRRRADQRRRRRAQGGAARRARDRRSGRDLLRLPGLARAAASRSRSPARPTIADGIAIKRPGGLTLPLVQALGRRRLVVVGRTTSPRRWSCCSSAPSSWSRAPAPSASRRCSPARSCPPRAARPSSCSRAATSTPACSRPSRCGTRPPRAGGCASSPASRTGRAGSRGCSRGSPRRAATSSRSTHVREAVPLHLRQTGIDLVLETRGADHADEIVARARAGRLRDRAVAEGAVDRRRARAGPGVTSDAATDGRTREAAALAELLRRPRFEILPLEGIEEQVLAHLGTDVKVTVTASPRKGLERDARRFPSGSRAPATRSCRTSRRGWCATTRSSRRSLERLLRGRRARAVRAGRRCARAGRVRTAPSTCSRRWGRCATRFDEIGITGYPETHHLISDEETIQAMFAKAPMATCIISQICFDAERDRGVDRARSGAAAPRCRSGSACRAASTTRSSCGSRCRSASASRRASCACTRNWMSRLLTRQFKPDPLLRGLAPTLADPAAQRRRLPPLHVQRGGANRALATPRARAAERLTTRLAGVTNHGPVMQRVLTCSTGPSVPGRLKRSSTSAGSAAVGAVR